MKKYCLVTFLFAVLVSMPMFAYDFVQNGIYYNIEDDHVSVTYSGSGVYTGSVSIPSQVTYNGVTYPVTAIGEWAFEGGEGMTYLSIPSSITSIGEYAFIDCGSNIEVRIANLTAWCKVQFGNEHSSPLSSAKSFYSGGSVVTSLVIPDGVESIPNFAFYQCRSITSLYIPSSVKSIGSSAFEDCTGLKSAYLSEGVESIGGSSFEGCTNLSTIVFPGSLTSIAINAFRNCTSLNTIASRIEDPFAFDENVFSTYSTATLIVPEGAISAYQSTDGWNLFTNITDDPSEDPTRRTIHVATAGTLPSLISDDEKYQIEELTLTGELNGTDFRLIRDMAGVTEKYSSRSGQEGYYFVSTNGKLVSLDLTDANIVGGGGPYLETTDVVFSRSLTRTGMDYSYYTEDDCISSGLFYKTRLVSIKIPKSVTSIGNGAFSACSSLPSISIPNSVTSIGKGAFSGSGWYNNQANGLLYLDNWLLGYKGDKPVGELSIVEGTKGIAGSAFGGCSDLTSIFIPNSVTSIGEKAFIGCSGLNSIVIENGNSNYDSRNNCNAIIEKSSNTLITGCKNTAIPNSVASIDDYAFYNCSGLTSVTIPNSVTYIGNDAFYGCSGLTSVTIPNSVTSIGSYAFSGCSGLTSVTIPNSVTSIGNYAFYRCSGLTSVTIPNSVTYIVNGAFYGCSGLTSVTIPNSVTSIGYYAFSGCSGLTSVTIPNSVTSIGSSAFSGCSGLTSVTIPNSVTSIGYDAFYNCDGLTSVTIPNSVTSIGSSAFSRCSGLTSVTIPNSVTSIGGYAFSGCSGLTSIVSLNSNPPSLQYSSVFYNVDKNICVVWVPKGSLSAYKGAAEWKDFANIFELVEGDLNLDDVVDQNDMDALVGFVMGKNPEGFYEGLADLNGDNKIDAADVVKMVDLVSASSGLGTVSQFVIENSVVSSLTCTLNNERSEAIQLTKCELYCNHNLVSYQSFSGASASVAAGGSKQCSFTNLAKYASSTGFTVCWYYTANGKNYVYRCPLKE